MWQTVKSLTTCLSKPFRDANDEFRKALMGSKGGEELWRYCVTDTNGVLGFAVGAMFVRQVFQGNSKAMVIRAKSHCHLVWKIKCERKHKSKFLFTLLFPKILKEAIVFSEDILIM